MKFSDIDWAKVVQVQAGFTNKDGKYFPIIEINGVVYKGTIGFSTAKEGVATAVSIIQDRLKAAGVADNFDYFTSGNVQAGNNTTH